MKELKKEKKKDIKGKIIFKDEFHNTIINVNGKLQNLL